MKVKHTPMFYKYRFPGEEKREEVIQLLDFYKKQIEIKSELERDSSYHTPHRVSKNVKKYRKEYFKKPPTVAINSNVVSTRDVLCCSNNKCKGTESGK